MLKLIDVIASWPPKYYARSFLRYLVFTVLIFSSVTAWSRSNREEIVLTPGIVSAIHNVITSQLRAFREDNEEKAFSYATPKLRTVFKNAKTFMKMVRQSYRSVYRPTSFDFQRARVFRGTVVQPAAVIGPAYIQVKVLYIMERQETAHGKSEHA